MKHVLSDLEVLAKRATYNDERKEAFRKAAMAVLRRLGQDLNLAKAVIRFNPGGVAVVGDASLQFIDGERGLYVNLTYSGGCDANPWSGGDTLGYARTASEKDPYGTGTCHPNHALQVAGGYEGLVHLCRSLLNGWEVK